MRELVLPGRFDPVSPSFTVRDVTTELSESRLTSCRTDECYLARNPDPGFPVDYLQPPSNLNNLVISSISL
ncbi:unnamed protein product [Schistosoma mattheei]|uniref:Uncharacterized protein n=1 Tax=Schistosoma mattheei TaxID=31246 RepID=A0A3P8KZT0_9TREM|nr:unnamed protein product [Schistosoma mattheei]